MVSILKTDKIQASHGNTIQIPTGHSVNAVDTAGIYAPGQIIQIVRTTPATTSSVTLASSPPNMIEFSADNRTTITSTSGMLLLSGDDGLTIGASKETITLEMGTLDIDVQSSILTFSEL